MDFGVAPSTTVVSCWRACAVCGLFRVRLIQTASGYVDSGEEVCGGCAERLRWAEAAGRREMPRVGEFVGE